MKKISHLIFYAALLYSIGACKTDASQQEAIKAEGVRQWTPEDTRSITGVLAKRGLIKKTDKATAGYVLFQPSKSTKTYLIDLDGNVVHSWTGELSSMNSYLLENGHLMRLERDVDFPTFAAGGQAGRIREYDWDGKLLWDFKYANEKELIHHDIEIMPNGHILAISYEVKSPEEAAAAGRNPEFTCKAGVWPDKIIEIEPTRPVGGNIVWEWHMWDHLVQDFDASKKNYGMVAENPRKLNINMHGKKPQLKTEAEIAEMKRAGDLTSNATPDNRGSDISHVNAISYNADLDQIVFSSPHFNEVYIIDHSTTVEEAKSNSGGRWGHGGDLLYRWGSPENYGRGNQEGEMLFGQHDIKWIPAGYPGAGHLMVFNNDIENPGNKQPSVWAALDAAQSPDPQIAIGESGNYSAVVEFVPPTNEDGSYVIPEKGPIGPEVPFWEYMAPDKYSFYSAFISGAHRLKNGNTFITSGAKGRLFEVTPEKEIVWEYWNPYNDDYKLPDGSPAQPVGPFLYNQFRATHFTTDYPAFIGKQLTPMVPQPEPFVFQQTPPQEKERNIH